MKIGVLGATGPAGSALAARLAHAGYDVVIGSRSQERAEEVRDEILGAWPGRDLSIEAATNEGAADTEVIFLSTPWDAAAVLAASVAPLLAGKVVISIANALTKIGPEFKPLLLPRGSIAADVQVAAPESFVAAALQHVPARELGDLDHEPDVDVLICSDHPHATALASEIVNSMPAMRALDAGELSNAMAIEAFTAVLLQLNMRYKTRVGIKLTGIRQ